jgi:hypothetical protein
VPDQPVSKFQLTLKGGGKGLLVNSTNICNLNAPAVVSFVGQNGKVVRQKPHLRNRCPKRKGGGKKHHHGRHGPAGRPGNGG